MQSRMPDNYTPRAQVEALLAEAREAASVNPGARGRGRPRRTRRTGRQRAARALANGLYAALIMLLMAGLYAGVQARLRGEPASLMGYGLFTVRTGSMVPTLPIGSYIVVRKPDDPAALPEGTVITFYNERGDIITHRIVEVVPEGGVRYRTKGDNPQNSPDPELVSPDQILGALQFSVSLPKVWQER